MRIQPLILILCCAFTVACAENSTSEAADSPWISTEEQPGSSMNAQEMKLQGSWQGEAKACSAFEEGMHTLRIEKGSITWNAFTQAYTLSSDTLRFGGMTFLIRQKDEEIQLKSATDDCLLVLSRRK
jgi:hypothetical protein